MRAFSAAATILVALAGIVIVTPARVAAFCEILEPPSDLPTEVTGTNVEIHLQEGFARVVIIKEFHNPSERPKEGQIFFPLEQGHELITDLRLQIGNVVYNASSEDRGEALDAFLGALRTGVDAALVQYDPPRDVYWIAVTIPPKETRTTITTLEMPLVEEDGFYTYGYRLSVDAGHSIDYLHVRVLIETSAPLEDVRIPSHPNLPIARAGDRQAEARIDTIAEAEGKDLRIAFRTRGTSVSQFAAAEERYIRFTIDATDAMFSGALRPLPRSFLFLVDASGSMGTRGRWPLAVKAVAELARDLKPGETFGLLAFQGPTLHLLSAYLQSQTGAAAEDVTSFLVSIEARGSTNFERPLAVASDWAARARRLGQQPFVFLLTDGGVTAGATGFDLETAYKRFSYDEGVPIFALAPAPDEVASERLLRNVTHYNHGSAVRLADGDPREEVAEVLAELRVPVLHDVSVEFPGAAGLAAATPVRQTVLEGGEVLAVARMEGSPEDPTTVRVTWTDREGTPRSFSRTYVAADLPVQSLLQRQWVLTRIHALLDALRAHQDPALLYELKAIATANRVVTPYTSLLVVIPEAEFLDSGSPNALRLEDLGAAGATLDGGLLQGPLSSGGGTASSRLTPLGQEARLAEAYRQDIAQPLLRDNEIDRWVDASSPGDGAFAEQLLRSDFPVRYEGTFVTVFEVGGELVAVRSGWLEPAAQRAHAAWSLGWSAFAILALAALFDLRRRARRQRL